MYLFIRGRQLEGTYPGSPETGVWPVSDLRVQKGWGVPPEASWPYDGDATHWPPAEPLGVDRVAKANRLFAYGRVRTLDDARRLLAGRHMFVAAFEVDESWYASEDGHIPAPESYQPSGVHVVRIVGYDNHERLLLFANSWGETWGERGYGYLPYGYWSQRLLEAWYRDADPPPPPRQRSQTGVTVRRVGVTDRFARTLHIVEVQDLDLDEIAGWSLIVETEERLEVEDLFVRPAFRGRGFGRELCNELRSLATGRRRTPICWIPHADWDGSPTGAQSKLLADLELTPRASPNRWAAAVAEGQSSDRLLG